MPVDASANATGLYAPSPRTQPSTRRPSAPLPRGLSAAVPALRHCQRPRAPAEDMAQMRPSHVKTFFSQNDRSFQNDGDLAPAATLKIGHFTKLISRARQFVAPPATSPTTRDAVHAGVTSQAPAKIQIGQCFLYIWTSLDCI
eukprot:6199227-Pleurochrysis_carterae.AAC.1